MATKTKALPKKPLTVVEQISELVDKHIDTVEAIIQEYAWLSDVGMDTELRAANEKLKEFSEGLEETKELSFAQLISKLQDIDDDDFDMDAVMDLFQGREYDENKLIKLIDRNR